MAEITLTINDKSYTADDGRTILQVVREYGIDDIPSLCYEERLGPVTACFICVVEVEGARGLVPSCSTHVQQGMVVRTRTEKVIEARRTCLELLFSDHPADCISPCAARCPGGIDIQGYVGLVRKGLYQEAIALIKDRNPLPIVCGRVCVRECEVGCRRAIIDSPVGIDFIKRYAAESREGMAFMEKRKPSLNRSIGIVGAGPAGLSASYYLGREGYDVTLYEAMPEPGGMLLYGIPAYRLPKDLLAGEIDRIRAMGVDIRCNTRLGSDVTVDELKNRHEALIISPGAWQASSMRVQNEDVPGVLSGLQILRDVAAGTLKNLTGKVLVVGGGNTAIDAARTAVRLGADETTILYRRTEKEMPAHHEEVDAARKEGVQFRFLVAPEKVVTDEKGRAKGLECTKMELGAPDESGRRKPVTVAGSTHLVEGDWIVAAIGQQPDLKGICGCGESETPIDTKRGCISIKGNTMETSMECVFAAGDAVSGPATVIEGIAGGRRAALAVHHFLTTGTACPEEKEFFMTRELLAPVTKEELSDFSHAGRHCMPEREPEERIKDFSEVELGLSKTDTEEEALRCLSCGCLEAPSCTLRKYAQEYGIKADHYLGETARHPADRRHPFISIEASKCIKCSRCIKTCESILGSSALGFVNRGFSCIIAPAMKKPLSESTCISCGNCIDSCPTGALTENQPLMARMGERVTTTPVLCSFCPAGCMLNIRSFGRDMRIRAHRDRVTGKGDYLCMKGRFGSAIFTEGGRIEQPMVRRGGEACSLDWHSALHHAAQRIREIKDAHGAGSIGVFMSPRLTNEEIYSAVKLAKGIIGTDHAGSLSTMENGSRHHALDPVMGKTCSTATFDDLENCDTIMIVNADPLETHPSLGWRIREASRRGSKIIVINAAGLSFASEADLWLQCRKGATAPLLIAVMREIIEKAMYVIPKIEGFAALQDFLHHSGDLSDRTGISSEMVGAAASMIAGKTVVALFDMDSPSAGADLSALAHLLLLTGNLQKEGSGLLLLERFCNSAGLYDMGAEPGFLAGRISWDNEKERKRIERIWDFPFKIRGNQQSLKEVLASGTLKGALVFGENPMAHPDLAPSFRHLSFLAACDLFPTETTDAADLVLPASSHLESGGTFTRLDGLVQHFGAASAPPAGKTTLQILSELASLMGNGGIPADYHTAFNEIASLVPGYGKGACPEIAAGRFAPCSMERLLECRKSVDYDSISARWKNQRV